MVWYHEFVRMLTRLNRKHSCQNNNKKKLNWDQREAVGTDKEKSEWVDIRRVKRGCVMSLDLFPPHGVSVKDATEDLEEIRVGGRNINDVRYVTEIALLDDSDGKLEELTGISA